MAESIRNAMRAGVAGCALALATTHASGQTVGTASRVGTATAETDALEEVIVTARRVEENVQTVPISIQAFDARDLREGSIGETRDLMLQVPGIYLGGSSSLDNTAYYLRGAGPSGPQGRSVPGVESYFDDVPLPTNAQSQPQYDISSIQVLKGPQGTLFGRNTVGGAILLYPTAPNYDGVNGYVQLTGGSYAWHEAEGAVNLPLLTNTLALRLSAHWMARNGYVENTSPGQGDGSNANNHGFRAQLLWDPATWLTNTTLFDYYQSDTHSSGISIAYADNGAAVVPTLYEIPFPPPINALPLGIVGTGNLYKSATGTSSPDSFVRQWGLTDKTSIDFGNYALHSILGYRRARYDAVSDNGGTPFVYLNTVQLTNEEQFTQELQLSSTWRERFHWLLGEFYLHSDPLQGNAAINELFINVLPPPLGSPAQASYPFETQSSKALYGNVDIDLTRNLTLQLGYRYTWDNYKLCTAVPLTTSPYNAQPFRLDPDQCDPGTTGLALASTAVGRSSAPTWSAALNWQATDNAFLYLTSRRGYRSGGLNGPAYSGPLAAFQTFSPERVTDVEAGMKLTWQLAEWRGLFDLALFQAKTDQVLLGALGVSSAVYNQVLLGALGAGLNPALIFGPAPAGAVGWTPCLGSSVAPGESGTSFDHNCNPNDDPTNTLVAFNGGHRTTKGIEFTAAVSPIDALTIRLGGTFYRFEFDPGAVPSMFLPYLQFEGITNVSDPGQQLGARTTLTASARYQIPLGSNLGQLVFNADLYHSGALAEAFYSQSSFEVVNFRLDWNNFLHNPLDLSVFVRNAFDEQYSIAPGGFNVPVNPAAAAAFAITNPNLSTLYARGAVGLIPAEPRLWGLQLRYRFGSK